MTPVVKTVVKTPTPPAAGLFGNPEAQVCIKGVCVPSETARAFAGLFLSSEGGDEPEAPAAPEARTRFV